jgi:hypothetical protein
MSALGTDSGFLKSQVLLGCSSLMKSPFCWDTDHRKSVTDYKRRYLNGREERGDFHGNFS